MHIETGLPSYSLQCHECFNQGNKCVRINLSRLNAGASGERPQMNVTWWDVCSGGLTRPVLALDYDDDDWDTGEGP